MFLVTLFGGLQRLFIGHQFIRYVLVGIGNTAFSYGIYAAFIFIGFEYRIASLLALFLGIVFSFVTQGKVVFKNATRITFSKFLMAWILIYILNISIISLLMKVSMSAYLAGAIAIVPVTLVSYFILKFAVFAQRDLVRPAKTIR